MKKRKFSQIKPFFIIQKKHFYIRFSFMKRNFESSTEHWWSQTHIYFHWVHPHFAFNSCCIKGKNYNYWVGVKGTNKNSKSIKFRKVFIYKALWLKWNKKNQNYRIEQEYFVFPYVLHMLCTIQLFTSLSMFISHTYGIVLHIIEFFQLIGCMKTNKNSKHQKFAVLFNLSCSPFLLNICLSEFQRQ